MLRHTSKATEKNVPAAGERSLRCLAWGSVIALVIVLVPLLVISFYNHSYADDWHYGVWAHLVLQETGGNVFAAFAEAVRQIGVAWVDWQGTYTAIFLMAFQPGIFGEGAYAVAAWIIIGSLVACTFYFAKVLLVDYLHADRTTWVCVSCVVLILQLLLQPSPVEGIFWYNSAIYYTFFHALALLLAGYILRTVNPARPRTDVRRRTVLATVLAVLVAGGNFVTLLVVLEVGMGLLVWMIATRDDRTDMVFAPVIALLVGAVVSFAAPGNAVRQATQFPEDKLGVLATVWESSVASFRFLNEWTSGLVIVGVLFLLPLLLRAVRSDRVPEFVRFRHPAWLTVVTLAVFASSFTPTFFSMGTQGPGRVQNCRFDFFVVMVVINVVWWAGWAVRRAASDALPADKNLASGLVPAGAPGASAMALAPVRAAHMAVVAPEPSAAHVAHGAGAAAGAAAARGTRATLVACSLAALVFAVIVVSMAANEDTRDDLTSVSAAASLVSGQAAAYDEQVDARLAFLASTKDENVRVPYYSDVPHVLLMGDIRDNMDNYINFRLAQWFGKDSIVAYQGSEMGVDPVAQAKADEAQSTVDTTATE